MAEASLIFPRYWVIKSVDLAGTQSREGRRLKKICLTDCTMTTPYLLSGDQWLPDGKWEKGEYGFPRRGAAAGSENCIQFSKLLEPRIVTDLYPCS